MTIGTKIIKLYKQVEIQYGNEYDENTIHYGKPVEYAIKEVTFSKTNNGENGMAGTTNSLIGKVAISIHDLHINDKVEFEGCTLLINTIEEISSRESRITCKS